MIELHVQWTKLLILLLVALACHVVGGVAGAGPAPDSAGVPPLPGPGLSYGGIPYGSMSGNVAEFFKRQATSSGGVRQLSAYPEVDFAPIEQYL